MKLKVIKIFILSLCINMVLFNGIVAEKKTNKANISVVPAQKSSIKTIIFDLGDVLFKASRAKRASVLIPMALRYPSLIYTLCTKDVKKDLFAMLEKIPAKTPTDSKMYNEGDQIPPIMVDWMVGRSNHEISAATLKYIAASKYSSSTKALYRKIIQMMFQPQKLTEALSPIAPMVQLAKNLKRHGYKLYVLSNWDKESFPIMLKKHAEIFKIFDGIMISGNEGMGKPHPEFYLRLLQKYNLKPHECVFIDDEKYNIKAANELGIHGVLKDSVHSVCAQLKNLGVLSLS